MTKRTRKFIASLMAGAMMVAAAVPAVAGTTSDVKDLYWVVSGDSVTTETEIKITVPTDISTIINPYGVDISDLDATTKQIVQEGLKLDSDSVSSTSIISPVYEVINESAIPVNVSIADFRVSGGDSTTPSENIIIATSPVAAKANAPKSAYIYMQFANESGKDFLGKTLKEASLVKGKVKMVASKDAASYKAALQAKDKILEVKAKDASKIKAGKEGAALKPTFDIAAKDGKAYIKIMGDVNSNPIISKTNKKLTTWNASDSLSISYKLVFTPRPNTKQ
jgi:hypothetical protein